MTGAAALKNQPEFSLKSSSSFSGISQRLPLAMFWRGCLASSPMSFLTIGRFQPGSTCTPWVMS
jgi:hypothetical protein